MIRPVTAINRTRVAVAKRLQQHINTLKEGRCLRDQRVARRPSWLSASILHDLRNPVGTICAGAEMLMTLDTAPTQVKRLAANMHRASSRMRELLIDLPARRLRARLFSTTCSSR